MNAVSNRAKTSKSSRGKPFPPWAKVELVNRFGLRQRDVDRMPSRVAWARLFSLRAGVMGLTDEQKRCQYAELAERLKSKRSQADWDTQELTDIITESVAALDRGPVERVAKGLEILLLEVAKAD